MGKPAVVCCVTKNGLKNCSECREVPCEIWKKTRDPKFSDEEFAKNIVFACRDMKNDKKESVLINQILRSATSIGANIHEAQYAQGTKDFISKLEIAQKECYETEYWLELLFETDCLSEENYKKLHNDCGAIRRMLISSLKTIKANHS